MRRTVLVLILFASIVSPAAAQQKPGDAWLSRPVDDRTFKSYRDFFSYERGLPFATKLGKREQDQGVRREWLSFQSTRGVRVSAILTEQAGRAPGKKPAIILLHGGGARGKENTVPFAALLARAGWTVLAIDLPHFGERTSGLLTTFSEQEKHDKLYNQPSEYLSWIIQVTKDVRRSHDLLVSERGAAPGQVSLIGFSRGAMAASIAGAVETRLAGVALLFAGHLDALENEHLPAACPANYVGRIAPRPLLMVNATQDSDMIRDTSVEPLFKLARQPKQIIWTEGGHMFMTEEDRASILQWLREKTRP